MTEAMKRLRAIVGAKAFHALRCGCRLYIWRQSTPHNWYIETSRGNTLWHSAPGEPSPNLAMFTEVETSAEHVCAYWGSDSGMPSKSADRLLPDT